MTMSMLALREKFRKTILFTVVLLGVPSLAAAQATNLKFGPINGGATPQAGVPFNVIVYSVRGASLDTVRQSTTVQLSKATGSGSLTGTLNGLIPAGRDSVVITGVVYSKAESNVSLTATATSGDTLLPDTSVLFTVSPGPATQIVMLTQPGASATAGVAFSPQPRVNIEDAQGNIVTSDNSTVVTAAINTGSGSLFGTTTATAVNGVATFINLSYQIAESITLKFTHPSLTQATSATVVVGPGSASTDTSTVSANPTTLAADGVTASTVTVQLKDVYGNNTTSAGPLVINATVGTLSPITNHGNGNYTATLTSTIADTSIVTATLNSSLLAHSATVIFTGGTATKFAVTMSGGTTPLSATPKTAGTPFLVRVTAQDANGNTATSYSGTVSLGSNAYPTQVPASIPNNGTGYVDNVGITPTAAGVANRVISATDGVISTSNASGNFTVNPGAASTSTSTVSANPTSIVADGSSTSTITVQLKDAYGNNLISTGGTVTATKTLGTLSAVVDSGNGRYGARLTAGTLSGLDTITASLNSTQITNKAVVTIAAGSVAKFAVTMSGGTIPLSSTPKTAGVMFPVRVTAQDANGNTVPGYTGTVNLTCASAFSGTVHAGISTGGFVDNINITPTIAGTGKVISASDGTVNTPGASSTFTVVPGAAKKLAVTHEPSSTATAGQVFATQPQVSVEDSLGNVITTDNASVITAQAIGGTATLGGTLTATASGGVAPFANLSYPKAETIRIRFTSATLVPDTSSTIAVGAGAATRVVVTREPSATAIAGQNFATQPQISIEDAGGNVITSDNGSQITVQVIGGTGGTLNGTNPLTVSAGVANFTDLNYTKMETIRLRFSSGSLTADTSTAIVVNHGAASTITKVSGDGQSGPISTSLSPMVVHLADQFNNPVDSTTVNFTVSPPAGGASGQVMNPSAALTGANGNASSVLTLGNKVGTYTVQAASTGVTGSPISFTATATPGAAGRLAFVSQPGATQIAGRVFSPVPSVAIEDNGGNIITSDNTSVITATLASAPPATGSLQGTTSVTVVNGVGTFSDLSYPKAEQINVQFSTTGLSSVNTGTITVNPDTAYALTVTQQPPVTVTAGSIMSPALKVQLVDQSGNAVSKSGVPVTVAVSSGNPELEGTKTQSTDASGAASFADLFFRATGGRRLQFTSSPLRRATSDSLTVLPAAPDTLAFVANPSTAAAGAAFATSPIVEVRDQFGNAVTGVSLTVSVALTNPIGATLRGTTTQLTSQQNGQATFPDLSVDRVGNYTLTASSPSAPKSGVSAPFTITPAQAVRLAFTQQPTTVVAGSLIRPVVIVAVQDTFGNLVTTSSDSIGLTLGGGGVLLGGRNKQASSGIANFDSLIVTSAGSGKFLTATAKNLTPATSALFQVRPSTASRLVFSTQPGDGVAGFAVTPEPVVTVQDQYGNAVTGFLDTVAVAIKDTATPGATLLNGPKTAIVDTSTGRATFAGIAIDKAGHGYTLTATGRRVTTLPGIAVSDTFNINPGTPRNVRVETLADGTGTLLVNQRVSSGTSITVYAIARDAYDNFVSNVAANAGGWSLTVFSGGVVPSDLVPSADRKSAVFSGHVVGTAQISAAVTGLISIPSDTITVVQAGAPSKVVVETADNGTGHVVPSQSLESGRSIKMYAIARDASDNFVGNIAADWLLVKLSGGIVDTDLVASGDKKSAVFTGHRVGSAQVLASSGLLSGVRSDTISVVHGAAATVLPVSGSAPQSTPVGSFFATPLAAMVVDSSGNSVPGSVVRFSAPLSGASSFFGARHDTSVVANGSGIATAPLMQANMTAGTYLDTAAVRGATPALFSLTNTAIGVDHFTITSTNSGQIGTQDAQVAFPIRIAARDSFGNVATGFNGTVEVSSTGKLLTGSGTTPNFTNGVLASYPVSFDATGFYTLTVRRTGGTESGTSDTITVQNPPPTFTSLTPGNGLAGSTVDITIHGSGFIAGVTVVLFSDSHIHAFSPQINSFTQLTVTVQIDSSIVPGAKNVTIANIQPGGGTVVVQNGFVVGNNPSPTLASIIPQSALRSQSLSVGLIGSNFVPGSSSVDFGQGITVNSVTVDSATHITAQITVSATAQLGDRQVTVSNAPPGGGTSQAVTFTVKADPYTPPTPAAPPIGYSLQGGSVTLQWTAPPSDSVDSYKVQIAGDTAFTTLVLDSTVTTLSMQVSNLPTYSTYFWRVRANRTGGGITRYSDRWSFNTYPAQLTLSLNVPFPSYGSPGDYKSSDYRMIGLPGADKSLVSKYLSGSPGTDWIAYYDNGADSSYFVKFTTGDTLFSFSRGKAFWVLNRGPWAVSGQVAGFGPDSSGFMRITLHPGWNMITNPTLVQMAWSRVQAANGGIGDSIWAFDGTTMGVSQTFKPYEGYYFENRSQLPTLVIPGGVSLGKVLSKAVPSDTSWSVSMVLKRGETLIDRSTWFGVAPDASNGYNRHDFHKPRSLGLLDQLAFDRPEWDARASRFACDIRPPVAGVQEWRFTAFTPDKAARGVKHSIEFSGIDRVPATDEVYLVDVDRETYQDLRIKGSYSFVPLAASSQFSVLVGSADEVRKKLDAIGPKSYSLDQNYPNPFNPTTTISFSVPTKSAVSVIIYDILGARVKVLENGSLDPGKYFLRWDGTNDAGRGIGTGVYFCRMSVAGGPSFTKKMLLLR